MSDDITPPMPPGTVPMPKRRTRATTGRWRGMGGSTMPTAPPPPSQPTEPQTRTTLPAAPCFKCGARGWCQHRKPDDA